MFLFSVLCSLVTTCCTDKKGTIPVARAVEGSQSQSPVPPPPVPRKRPPPSKDVPGLTLLCLPLLDCACALFLGRSVFYQPLVDFSVLLAIYVYLMYYEKVVAWLLQKHLGAVCKGSSLRAGAEVYRFNVDLSRVEEHLAGVQTSSSPTLTLTAAHIAVKAVGVALEEMRHMHGVLLADRLYRAPGALVNVSVTESSGAGDHAGIFLHNVHNVASSSASVPVIAQEVASNKQHHGANMSVMRLFLRCIQPFLPVSLTGPLVVYCNEALMACLLTLGMDVCPFGAARVVSVLPREGEGDGDGAPSSRHSSTSTSTSTMSPPPTTGGEMDENEIDFSVLPMTSSITVTRRGLCVPPVTVTLGYGGVKFIPVQHQEKKIVRKFRVVNVSVCLHEVLTSSPGCSLQERQEFISKLKSLLNNPKLLFPSTGP